ncbi:Heat shock protein 83 [Capsicum chinense]|nr:Heat shock protein 83 [Capsicum chinense]
MRTYLRTYDLWEVVEVGVEANPLPNNPTMAQIKNHREEVSKIFKALSCIQSTLSEVIFARVMASETAKEASDKLKEEFHGSDKIRQIKVINLRREFEILRMKDSETIEEFSNKLMKVKEATETALQAKFKGEMQMQEEGKIPETSTNSSRNNQGDSRNGVKKRENFPPCKYCRKINHKEDDCWFKGKEPPLRCRYCNKLGHIESGCTQHMTNKQEYFTKLESAKGSVKLADKTELEIVGKGTVAIEAPKGTKFIQDVLLISWSTWKNGESQADGLFTVTKDVNVEQLGRETKINLFLKEDQLEYLEEQQRIKDLVKHSEFISYPIYVWTEKTTEKEMSNDEDDEGSSKQALLNLTQDQGGNYLFEFDSTVTSVGTLLPHQLQLVGKWGKLLPKNLMFRMMSNSLQHKWGVRLSYCRNSTVNWSLEIFAEKPTVRQAYLNFVPGKMSGKEFKEFWTKYLRVEYHHSTKNIVTAFAKASEDEELAVFLKQDAMLASEARKKMNNIKLYVWRVFIMDNLKELMPEYFGFMKGVVDSDDLPLNISREMLQQNKILKVIRKNLVKKCIEMFNEIAVNKEDYNKFYEAFSKNLKLGIHEDNQNKAKLADLLRDHSTNSGDEMTSLKDYVTRMKEGQKDIYYITGESKTTSESFSPICLPRYNPMAFLHAYVHYLDVDTYLILLTMSSDAFHHLKDCRIRVEKVLLESNVLNEVQRSMVDGGMRVEDLPADHGSHSGAVSLHLGQPGHTRESSERFAEAFIGLGGPAGLWHFMYRSINLDQYVSSEFASPVNNRQQQKRLYRAYQKLYESMHDKEIGPHKTQFRRDENYVLLCWVTQDFELYAAFDPLADKVFSPSD